MGAENVKTSCPSCQRLREPLPSSTGAIAWYRCFACEVEWSARLRDGRPVDLIILKPGCKQDEDLDELIWSSRRGTDPQTAA
jgi:hypothetical protein